MHLSANKEKEKKKKKEKHSKLLSHLYGGTAKHDAGVDFLFFLQFQGGK